MELEKNTIQKIIEANELPEDPKDYLEFFEEMLTVAAPNPNLTHEKIKQIWREIVDLDEMEHSDDLKAKARKLMRRIALYMSRGDNPHVGLSTISCNITYRHPDDPKGSGKRPEERKENNEPGYDGLWKKGGD